MKSGKRIVSLMLVLGFVVATTGAQKRKSRPAPSSNVALLSAKIGRLILNRFFRWRGDLERAGGSEAATAL